VATGIDVVVNVRSQELRRLRDELKRSVESFDQVGSAGKRSADGIERIRAASDQYARARVAAAAKSRAAATEEYNALKRVAEQAVKGSHEQAAAAKLAEQAARRLGIQEQHLAREADHANRSLLQTARGAVAGSGAFRSLGRQIAFASSAYLGAAGFTTVVRASISAASDLNEEMNKARVVFRGSEADILSWSKTTAGALGISRQEALATASVFGNMLVPMGYARDTAEQMSKRLVTLAADMASFNNADPSEVLEALRSGLAGEVEPLRRFGVQLSDARERQVLMAAGVKDLGATLLPQQRTWAAYQLILRDTADAQGDFARTSGGLANQQRILHAQIQNLEAGIGKALLPTVKNVTTGITAWLSKSENQERVQKDVTEAVDAARDAFGAIATVIGTVNKVTGGLKQTIELLIGLSVASKVAGWTREFTLLAGSSAAGQETGAAGAAVKVSRLRSALGGLNALAVAPIVIPLELNVYNRETKAIADKFGGGAAGVFKAVEWFTSGGVVGSNPITSLGHALGIGVGKKPSAAGSAGAVDTLKLGAGVSIPQSIRATHQTAGLAGFPAVDIMAKPGTPIRAPEDGIITRISGHEPTEAPPEGQGGPWGLSIYFLGSQTGNTYYLTHLVKVAKIGRYKKGAVIGVIGDYPGSPADHVHVGIHQGKAGEAFALSGSFRASDFLGASAAASTSVPPPSTTTPRPGPSSRLDQLRAAVDATANAPKPEELAALRALRAAVGAVTVGGVSIQKFIDNPALLRKLNADQLKKAQTFINELNQTQSQIESLLASAATKRKAKAKGKASLKVPGDVLGPNAHIIEQGTPEAALKARSDALNKIYGTMIDDATSNEKKLEDAAKLTADRQGPLADIRDALSAARLLPADETVQVKNRFGALVETLTGPQIIKKLQTLAAQIRNAVKPDDLSALIDQANGLFDQLSSGIDDAAQKAQDAFQKIQDGFDTAFGDVQDRALQAFDAQTDRIMGSIGDRFDDLRQKVDDWRQSLTDSEKALRDLQSGREAQQFADDLAAAQKELNTALAHGSNTRIANAQKALNDLLYQQNVDRLQAQADAERAARDAEADAQKKALDAQQTVEERNAQSQRNEDRVNFQKDLDVYRAHLNDKTRTTRQNQDELLSILQKYGVDYADTGALLGVAFADAFSAAIRDLFENWLPKYLQTVSGTNATVAAAVAQVTQYTRPGPTVEYVPGSNIRRPGLQLAAGAIVPHRPGGWDVTVGEGRYDEAVVPLPNGVAGLGGGDTYIVNIPNYVGDKAELMETVRRELLRLQKRNGGTTGIR
jgi:murein DD-endopeptidase MepM/ murein hydrolase activator NlpD